MKLGYVCACKFPSKKKQAPSSGGTGLEKAHSVPCPKYRARRPRAFSAKSLETYRGGAVRLSNRDENVILPAFLRALATNYDADPLAAVATSKASTGRWHFSGIKAATSLQNNRHLARFAAHGAWHSKRRRRKHTCLSARRKSASLPNHDCRLLMRMSWQRPLQKLSRQQPLNRNQGREVGAHGERRLASCRQGAWARTSGRRRVKSSDEGEIVK